MTPFLLGLAIVATIILVEVLLWRGCRREFENHDIEALWSELVARHRVRTWHIPKHAYPRVASIRREVSKDEFLIAGSPIHFIAAFGGLIGICLMAASVSG